MHGHLKAPYLMSALSKSGPAKLRMSLASLRKPNPR